MDREQSYNYFKELFRELNNTFYNEYNSTIRIYFEQDNMILQVDSLNGYHHWCTPINDINILFDEVIFKMYEHELIKNAIERNGIYD